MRVAGKAAVILPLLARSWLLILFVFAVALSPFMNDRELHAKIQFVMLLMTILGAAWLVSLDSVDRILATFVRLGVVVLWS